MMSDFPHYIVQSGRGKRTGRPLCHLFAIAQKVEGVCRREISNYANRTPSVERLNLGWSGFLADFDLLGISSVAELRQRNPKPMYDELFRLKRQRLDPCCLDVLIAAVAQAKDPNLPIEQRQWWYWSKIRKRKAGPAETVADSLRHIIE